MKKILAFLLAVVCVLGVYCYAEDADDSESSLMELFMMETRSSDISVFEYGDYDGDGIHEAFALLPKQGWNSDGEGYYGELWFVSPRQCTKIHDEDSYLTLSKEGAGPMLFTAEVWYGGSGSTSYIWGVSQSSKAEILGKEFEGISGGEMPNEFYMYPSAFDQSTDGTGHTWKRYYFFLDGLELKEYGGLWISRNQLEEVEGGEAILQKAEEEGWTIGDIYYRANGIINVNLHDEWSNDNLTLRFDGNAVVDTGERFGGVYESASGLAEAVYPETFEHEVSENTAIGRAIISASVDRQTLPAGSRDEILRARGIVDTDDLINVTGAAFSQEKNNQLIRVYFKDNVFAGGSEGYWEEWLTANGAISEAMADLDGDGTDEYLLIYLVSEHVKEDAFNYTYWSNRWNLAVYEPKDDGYVLTCDFPISFPWWDERSVGLIHTDEGVKVISTYGGSWDGGGGAVGATVYRYGGQSAVVEAVLYASVGGWESYFMTGPIAPEDAVDISSEMNGNEEEVMKRCGLVEGTNYWTTKRQDREYDGGVFIFNDNGDRSRLNRNAFVGFDEMAAMAEKYGIHAFYTTSVRKYDEYTYEYYDMYLGRGDIILLWASEGSDKGGAYIDIITHFVDDPIVNGTGVKENIPSPLSVISAIPDAPDDAFAALEAALEIEQENKTEAGVRYLRVTNDVNMRDKPNLNGGVITSIPKGTTIEFLNEVSTDERGVDWYRMRYGNREGWTSSKYTVFDDGIGIVQDSQTKQTSKQTSGTAKITGNVNMREEPNLNGNVITSISKGATVDFLGDVSTDERGVDWYRIRYKGNEGWTSSKYTKLN